MLRGKRWMIGAALAMAGVVMGVAASQADATLVTLNDANSTVDFDTATSNGTYNWVIDSVDVLSRQWFWYRIGGSGPAASIDQISATPTVVTGDTGPNIGNDLLQLVYENATLQITLLYTLSGGQTDSGSSTLVQQLTIKAKQTLTGPLEFFQYADFNLAPHGTDSLNIANGNTAHQTGDDGSIQQTAATPAPTTYQADTGNHLLSLLGSGNLTLDNNPHTVTGDVNQLFGWNFGTMTAGRQVLLSIPQTVNIIPPGHGVPEPAALALFAVGLVLIAGNRHKRSTS